MRSIGSCLSGYLATLPGNNCLVTPGNTQGTPYIMPPIPPIPPMPPIPPPPGMGGASSLISVMTASAVVSREATPDASVMALRTTCRKLIKGY